MGITNQIRRALIESREVRATIARESGVGEDVLSRFAAGADARGATLDRLAEFFQLTLQAKGKRHGNRIKKARTAK